MRRPPRPLRLGGKSRFLAPLLVLLTPALRPAPSTAAPGQESPPVEDGFDLGSLYRLGAALADENGDGFPDRLRATVRLPDPPEPAELAAGMEIAARLGLETAALDLPLPAEAPVTIAVGGGDAAPALDPGAGEVRFAAEAEGEATVTVRGGDDAGLRAAAAWLAGRAPLLYRADGTALDEVGQRIAEILEESDLDAATPRAVRVTLNAADGHLASARFRVEVEDAAAAERAAAALREAAERLRYPDLAALSVVFAHAGDETETEITGNPTPPAPGPVPSRPGGGGLDREASLAGLFEPGGLLGDTNGDRIPDRLDATLVADAADPAGALALAARLGLESAGLDFPAVVEPAAEPGDFPSTPVLLGVAPGNPRLAERGVSGLAPGEGLIEISPGASDPDSEERTGDETDDESPASGSALLIAGGDAAGLSRALRHTALHFPHLDERGADRPTIAAVEDEAWRFLSGRGPAGQAASAFYRLERIAAAIGHLGLESSRLLVSLEQPAPGLERTLREAAERLGFGAVEVELDDRDVENAAVLHEEEFAVPSEIEAFRALVEERLLPAVSTGDRVRVRAQLSEPAEIRRDLEAELRDRLRSRGAALEEDSVVILSAYRQGYGWVEEVVLPRLVALREAGSPPASVRLLFRRHEPPESWPQQAMHTPLRFQHAMFPADEMLAEALGLDLSQVGWELREEPDAPAYRVVALDAAGETLFHETFEPRMVERPFLDRYPDYEWIQVPTGGLRAEVDGAAVLDERIATEAESFWDHYQSDTLARLYDHLMELHEGKPRGDADAPYFGELEVVLSLSEPERRLGLEQEIESTHDALHEDIYFVTHTFLRLIGRNSLGSELTYAGRVIPEMRPKTDGTPGTASIRLTGFRTSRPAVVVEYRTTAGDEGSVRRNLPKVEVERPRARRATTRAGEPGLTSLTLQLKVDTDADERAYFVERHGEDAADERILSGAEAVRSVEILGELREAGHYRETLAFRGLGELRVETSPSWEHAEGPVRRVTLPPNGEPPPVPRIADFRGDTGDADRLVQWESPIAPAEAHGILARMDSFPEATAYRVGRSYLGRPVWAMDLMPEIRASHASVRKAALLKPTIVYSARQHANEVSSTSHVLRLAEMLLTDPEHRKKLDRVNVVIHPVMNPDGAQLAWDMHQLNPEHILHAGYWASLGMDATSGAGEPMPIYPEAEVRPRLWRRWLPDIFLNPHGYPAHQLVQLFSEFSGLVRAGRRTERHWGFNKGWFMPGFDVVDDPALPRHREAALAIRKYITDGINSVESVAAMNERTYGRYRRYGMQFEPEVFRMDLHDGVNIQMPIKGRRADAPGRGFSYDPKITIWAGGTEAPDEPARGEWMELVASAGLAWDLAVLQYLLDGDHRIEREVSDHYGGVSIRLDRPRPPRTPPGGPDAPEAPDGPGLTLPSKGTPSR